MVQIYGNNLNTSNSIQEEKKKADLSQGMFDIIRCRIFAFQIHMDVVIVSTVHKSNKNICFKKSRSEVSIEVYNNFSY
jgi:hypothetical protein